MSTSPEQIQASLYEIIRPLQPLGFSKATILTGFVALLLTGPAVAYLVFDLSGSWDWLVAIGLGVGIVFAVLTLTGVLLILRTRRALRAFHQEFPYAVDSRRQQALDQLQQMARRHSAAKSLLEHLPQPDAAQAPPSSAPVNPYPYIWQMTIPLDSPESTQESSSGVPPGPLPPLDLGAGG